MAAGNSTDVAGSAAASKVVPWAVTGRTHYLEAAVIDSSSTPTRTYDSNVLTLVVQ